MVADSSRGRPLARENAMLRARVAELEAALAGPAPSEPADVSKHFLHHLVEAIPDMVSCQSPDGTYLYVSPACRTLLGYTPEELLGHKLHEYAHPEDLAEAAGVWERARETGEPQVSEYRCRTASGEYVWVEMLCREAVDGPEDSSTGIVCVTRDISARKAAEQREQESLARLRLAMESADEGIWEWDFETGLVTLDEAALWMLGYPPDLPPRSGEWWIGQIHDEERAEVESTYAAFVAGDLPRYRVEFRLRRRDGAYLWVNSTARIIRKDAAGHPLLVIGIHREISERKELERAAHEANLRREEAVKAGSVGFWDWDLETNKVHYSAEWKRQIGYEDHEIGDDFEEWQSRVHPDDLPATRQRIERMVKANHGHYSVEFRFRHKDSSYRWILAQASVYPDDAGQPVRVLGSHVDITERKQAERQLQENNRRLDELAVGIPGAIYQFRMRPDGSAEVPFISKSAVSLFERPLEELHDASRLFDDVHPADRAGLWPSIEESRRTMARWQQEFRVMTRSGAQKWLSATSAPHAQPDGSTLWNGVILDITETKNAEQALKQSEAFLSTLLDAIPIPVFYKDRAGRYLGANRAFEVFVGLSSEELSGKTVFDLGPRHLAETYQAKDNELFEHGGIQQYESQVRNAAGDLRAVVFSKAVFKDYEGVVGGLIGAILDITERKQAEEVIKEQVRLLDNIMEYSPFAMWIADASGRLLLTNKTLRDRLGLEDEKVRHAYDMFQDANLTEQDLLPMVRTVFEEHQPIRVSIPWVGAKTGVAGLEGTPDLWIDAALFPIVNDAGKLTHVVCQWVDITERKRAQDALRESERFLRATLDGLSSHIAVLDAQGDILLVNAAWRRFAEENGARVAAVSEGVNYLHVCDAAAGRGVAEAGQVAAAIRSLLADARDVFTIEYPCHAPHAARWFVARVTAVAGGGRPCVEVAHENITPRKQAEAALSEYNEQLRCLARELTQAEEAERRRVSDYLHDRVGQALSAIRLKFTVWKGMESASERDKLLAEISQLIDRTVEETRSLTFELSPPILYELGLGPALEWLGENLLEREGIAFEHRDDGRCPMVDDTLASALYRIARELLLNVVKHARADAASITLTTAGEKVCLEIADDGTGILSSTQF